jgi:Tfp pilus assembly protein PilF
MRYQTVNLDQRVITRLQSEPNRLPESEAQARLGDLLHHAGRHDEATTLLANVLKTTPELPLAHAALGGLLLRQDKDDEALAHLQRAAAALDADEVVQFYYGGALIERATRNAGDDADLRTAIVALERAVTLRSGFADAERMLGYAYLATNQADKSEATLRRALDDAPGDENVALMLAQAYLQLGRIGDARALLGPLLGRAKEPDTKERARELLGRSAGLERQQQVRNEVMADATALGKPADTEPPSPPITNTRAPIRIPALREVQPGETRTYGLLTEIECQQQQLVLHVRVPGEALLLRAPRFDAVDFISYRSTTPGRIACGPRRPAEDVYVTWRPGEASVPSGTSAGTAVAVELLPDGYVPTK